MTIQRIIQKSEMPILLGISLFLWCLPARAQETVPPADSTVQSRVAFFALPVLYFTPETRFAFGAAGVANLRLWPDSLLERPSQIQLGFAYTQNRQILLYLPFQFFGPRQAWQLYGELGYYRYNYFFFGIGNGQDPDFSELYGVNFPRVRLNALKRLGKSRSFAGLRYWLDDFRIQELDPAGQLIQGQILGSEGGLLSGLGAIWQRDTRDRIFYPRSGSFAELVLFYNGQVLGSPFSFGKLFVDWRGFVAAGKRHVWALNAYGEFTAGQAPFNQLAFLGGPRRMRGYFEGQFRDRHHISLQAEYRLELPARLGLVAFAALGEVSDQWFGFGQHLRYAVGLGLRITLLKADQVNLRIDAGFGPGTSGYYLTVGEAF